MKWKKVETINQSKVTDFLAIKKKYIIWKRSASVLSRYTNQVSDPSSLTRINFFCNTFIQFLSLSHSVSDCFYTFLCIIKKKCVCILGYVFQQQSHKKMENFPHFLTCQHLSPYCHDTCAIFFLLARCWHQVLKTPNFSCVFIIKFLCFLSVRHFFINVPGKCWKTHIKTEERILCQSVAPSKDETVLHDLCDSD